MSNIKYAKTNTNTIFDEHLLDFNAGILQVIRY